MLLPETTEACAEQWAERLRSDLAAMVVQVGAKQIGVTASFGVATLWPDDTDLTLLKRADLTLYWAKERGRNRVEEEAGPQPAPPTE